MFDLIITTICVALSIFILCYFPAQLLGLFSMAICAGFTLVFALGIADCWVRLGREGVVTDLFLLVYAALAALFLYGLFHSYYDLVLEEGDAVSSGFLSALLFSIVTFYLAYYSYPQIVISIVLTMIGVGVLFMAFLYIAPEIAANKSAGKKGKRKKKKEKSWMMKNIDGKHRKLIYVCIVSAAATSVGLAVRKIFDFDSESAPFFVLGLIAITLVTTCSALALSVYAVSEKFTAR
jgi:hypothetical protein